MVSRVETKGERKEDERLVVCILCWEMLFRCRHFAQAADTAALLLHLFSKVMKVCTLLSEIAAKPTGTAPSAFQCVHNGAKHFVRTS